MNTIKFQIAAYTPRHEKLWESRPDGSFVAEVYTTAGVVKVFTFKGDEMHDAFTTLEVYLDDEIHHSRLPRHYHQRWIRRIASEFAWQVIQSLSANKRHHLARLFGGDHETI